MRELLDHRVNPANDILKIEVTDEIGAGSANHRYVISGFETGTNASLAPNGPEPKSTTVLLFQNGPIPEVGVNGLTHEALLAVVADRLRSFQKGAYSTKENACALTHIEEAMHWLHARTLSRMRRGVEGTHTV